MVLLCGDLLVVSHDLFVFFRRINTRGGAVNITTGYTVCIRHVGIVSYATEVRIIVGIVPYETKVRIMNH